MSITEPSAFEREALAALASQAGLAGALLAAWSQLPARSVQSAYSLTAAAQLGVTEERGAQHVLERCVNVGLVEERAAGRYVARAHAVGSFARLAYALRSIAHYRANVHRDTSTAQVVLTKPAAPSALEEALGNKGWRLAALEQTDRAFHAMAQLASDRLVVMTPFLDVKGALWLRELLSLARPGVQRVLILRYLDEPERADHPKGFGALASWLEQEHIAVFSYAMPRQAGRGSETFHAKVVLCDRERAYVGSANLTSASLEFSMEMGVLVQGKAAEEVALVVDAVLAVARRHL